MGGTLWSDEHYRSRAKHRRATGRSAFEYDSDIRAQKVKASVHADMDPSKIRNGIREARDSDKHPQSNAVAVLFDVTGSMGSVPRILQKNLCTLMGLCERKGYLSDPAILIGGVGDATCDIAPLQVGQFESGNEIEDDLSRLFLEGGGGGQQTESYELALYFLARKTAIDCFEKRGKKGYAFLIGDEMPYKRVKSHEVRKVFGDHLQADIPIQDIVREAQEKYEVYYILPNLTSYYDDPKIMRAWRKLLGQNVLKLEDPAGISELIASTIGLSEEAVGLDEIQADLSENGVKRNIAKAVTTALSPTKPSGGLAGTTLAEF